MQAPKLAPRPSLALPLCTLLACHPPASPTDTDAAPATGSSSTGPLDQGPMTTSSSSSSTSWSSTGAPIPTTTEPSITGSSSEDTGAAAVCGDGLLDPDEMCDAGADLNDEGPCTLDCKLAVCGDGKLHVGVEACDLGVDNSDAYGGCGADCQQNPFCGDGLLDPTEQCDTGVKNGEGESPPETVPCTAGCRWDARLVFLSSELVPPARSSPRVCHSWIHA